MQRQKVDVRDHPQLFYHLIHWESDSSSSPLLIKCLAFLASLSVQPMSLKLKLKIKCHVHVEFVWVSSDLNSGFHMCTASTLTTEQQPSSQIKYIWATPLTLSLSSSKHQKLKGKYSFEHLYWKMCFLLLILSLYCQGNSVLMCDLFTMSSWRW